MPSSDDKYPACVLTGRMSSENIPVVYPGEDIEDATVFVHPSQVGIAGSQFDFCRCCGQSVAYPEESIDVKGLCPDHKGEFDFTPEEEEDIESLVEYLTKDS